MCYCCILLSTQRVVSRTIHIYQYIPALLSNIRNSCTFTGVSPARVIIARSRLTADSSQPLAFTAANHSPSQQPTTRLHSSQPLAFTAAGRSTGHTLHKSTDPHDTDVNTIQMSTRYRYQHDTDIHTIQMSTRIRDPHGPEAQRSTRSRDPHDTDVHTVQGCPPGPEIHTVQRLKDPHGPEIHTIQMSTRSKDVHQVQRSTRSRGSKIHTVQRSTRSRDPHDTEMRAFRGEPS